MFNEFFNRFRKNQPDQPAQVDEEAREKWAQEKSARMEKILGKEHDMVMHAIIPYAIGGGLDLYYYPHDIEGVGVATKELSESPHEGSSNRLFKVYELVMFTRHALNLDQAGDEATDFGKAHSTINTVLNMLASYSAQATLNPNETLEFPEDMDGVGGKCFILDAYRKELASDQFGMMLVMEVFRPEMEYARKNGGGILIEKLKERGYYPYSDLDREMVV